jgi:hypothetical protein
MNAAAATCDHSTIYHIFMDTTSAMAQDHLRKAIDDELKVSEQVTQQLKYHCNALAPISHLPPETLTEIFSLLPLPVDVPEVVPYLEWMHVTHVCHRWHEVALSFPYLWNHINSTDLTPAGTTEILAQAKLSPLHFKVKITPWNEAQFNSFKTQLEAHISYTHHLTISGDFQNGLEQLVFPAPALVSLNLMNSSYPLILSPSVIPDSFFNGSAPKLTQFELHDCSIRWKLPLLKGLQTLKIRMLSAHAMPTLKDWLTALNEMSQLTMLHLANTTPAISIDSPLISDPQRAVTLPSLTHLDIYASANDCVLTLTHLMLPALILLCMTSLSHSQDGNDVQLLISHVA